MTGADSSEHHGRLSQVCGAIANPVRIRLLEALAAGPASAGELSRDLPISQAAISRHLGKLSEAGLVSVVADRQYRIYRLEPTGFDLVSGWLAEQRRFWSHSLDRLAEVVRHDELAQRSLREGTNDD